MSERERRGTQLREMMGDWVSGALVKIWDFLGFSGKSLGERIKKRGDMIQLVFKRTALF